MSNHEEIDGIGMVESISGEVFIIHHGIKSVAIEGMILYEGDVIQTEASGNVGIIYTDNTTVALGGDSRMVIESMSFDSDAGVGNFSTYMVQGTFSFVSGGVAKLGDDAMVFKTPVATIGIRGTTVAGTVGAEGSQNTFTLLPDANGGVGSISVTNSAGTQVLTQQNQTTTVASFFIAPVNPFIMSASQVAQYYDAVIQMRPIVPSKVDGKSRNKANDDDEAINEINDESIDEGINNFNVGNVDDISSAAKFHVPSSLVFHMPAPLVLDINKIKDAIEVDTPTLTVNRNKDVEPPPDEVEEIVDEVEEIVDEVEEIVDEVEEIVDEVEEIVDEVEEIVDEVEEIVDEVEEIVDEVEEIVDEVEEIVDEVEEIVDEVEEIVDEVEEIVDEVEEPPTINNIAPILTTWSTSDSTYTENSDAIRIDKLLSLTDADSSEAMSATITISNYIQGEDVLNYDYPAFNKNVEWDWNDDTGIMTLTMGIEALANYQTVLRMVTYENTSADPNITARTITFTVTDDTGMTSGDFVSTVNIEAINDAPISSNPNLLVMGNELRTLTEADFGFTDADSITHVKITKTALLGELTLNVNGSKAKVSIDQEITIADINAGKLIYEPYLFDGIALAAKALDNLKFQLFNGTLYSDEYSMTVDVANVGTDFDDNLLGSGSSDLLIGGKGNDTLDGQGRLDDLYGGEGDDKLYGGEGDDKLYGGEGDDKLYGGEGDDKLYGGEGADTFGFTSTDVIIDFSSVDSADTITDFLSTQGDTIELEGFDLGDSLTKDLNYIEMTWQGANVDSLNVDIQDGSLEMLAIDSSIDENQAYVAFLVFTNGSITSYNDKEHYLLYDDNNRSEGMNVIAKLDNINGSDAIDVTDFSIL